MPRIVGVIKLISEAVVILLMLLVVADVVGRYFLNSPIKGTFEISSLMMAVVIFFAFGYVALAKGNIKIEIISQRLPRRVQAMLDIVGTAAGALFFGLITWQGVKLVLHAYAANEVTDVLHLATYPVKIAVPLGAAVATLVFLWQLAGQIRLRGKASPGKEI